VTFEVPVSAVSRSRPPRGVLAVITVSGLIVLGAAIAGVVAPSSPSAPSALQARAGDGSRAASPGAPAPLFAPGATPPFEPVSFNRPLPTAMECHAVAPGQCRRLVRAALRVLPDELPTVGHAVVWASLVCNDNFDCPSEYLRDAQPAGSVVVEFADGSRAVTVNVVDWGYGSSVRLGLRAWLVPTF
jgi:hypothetical protein